MKERLHLLFIVLLILTTQSCFPSRFEMGRGTGYDTLDLTIGVLPVAGSLNPNQNMYPGLANAMNSYQLFKSIEPVASAPNKQFDLLLICSPPGFASDIKVVSGYSNKVLYTSRITALYGIGAKKAVYEIASAFAVGKPAHQEIIAEREVYKRKLALAQKKDTAPLEWVPSDIDNPSVSTSDMIFNENDLAIVIGIEHYQGLPKSDFSRNDAILFKDYLKALGIAERNIEFITDEKATFTAIKKTIESWLPNKTKNTSRGFVYYSGHGAPEPKSGNAFIVPFDGDPNYLEDTGYALNRLYESLSRLHASEIIVVLDACFSGSGGRSVLAKGARPLVMTMTSIPVAPNMAVITGTQGSQISTSSPEKGHGIFTYYFLKALKDGKKTVSEIYEYIKPLVEDEAKQLNVQQSPNINPDVEKLKGRFSLRK